MLLFMCQVGNTSGYKGLCAPGAPPNGREPVFYALNYKLTQKEKNIIEISLKYPKND